MFPAVFYYRQTTQNLHLGLIDCTTVIATHSGCIIVAKPSSHCVPFAMRRDWSQVETVLLDYDENSEIMTYNQTTNEHHSYKGVEVRQRYRTLYKLDLGVSPSRYRGVLVVLFILFTPLLNILIIVRPKTWPILRYRMRWMCDTCMYVCAINNRSCYHEWF